MAKAILRVEKVNKGSIGGRGAHNHRTKPVENSDPERIHLNRLLIGTPHLYADIKKRLNEGYKGETKIRKDAVFASEMVLTASPAFFEKLEPAKLDEWVNANLDFAKERYGEANIVNAVLHLDEETPHLHLMIVPLTTEGRLNYKAVYGGPKDLSKLQTDYALKMKPFGLERGIERDWTKGQKVKHKELKEYKTEVANALAAADPKAKAIKPQIPKEMKNFLGYYSTDEVLDLMRYQQRRFYNANKPAFSAGVIAAELKTEKELREKAEKVLKATVEKNQTLNASNKALAAEAENLQNSLNDSRARNRALKEQWEKVPETVKNDILPKVVQPQTPSLEKKQSNGLKI